jgi:hypothetical protein
MHGSDITIKHMIAQDRFNQFLVESERNRNVDLALAGRGPRRNRFVDVRAFAANALLRAGSWLMPEDDCCRQPATSAFGR